MLNVAHRGGPIHTPENTFSAFDNTPNLGTDWVESDLRSSKDGEIVLIHDSTVDRTTDGAGYVDTLSLAQVRDLDAGSWLDPAFREERVPTLEEVLDLCRRRTLVLIEAKTVEAAEQAAVLVRSWRAQSHVIIQSFHGMAVRAVNRLDRRIPTAFLMTGGEAGLRRKTGVVRRVLKLGANALVLKHRAARPELVRSCWLGRWGSGCIRWMKRRI